MTKTKKNRVTKANSSQSRLSALLGRVLNCILSFNREHALLFKNLTGEPVLDYLITDGSYNRKLVSRRESDVIKCTCGGEFIKTGAMEEQSYYKHIPYLYQCNRCNGKISVMRYTKFGVNDPDTARL
jgi:hypothetical protein